MSIHASNNFDWTIAIGRWVGTTYLQSKGEIEGISVEETYSPHEGFPPDVHSRVIGKGIIRAQPHAISPHSSPSINH